MDKSWLLVGLAMLLPAGGWAQADSAPREGERREPAHEIRVLRHPYDISSFYTSSPSAPGFRSGDFAARAARDRVGGAKSEMEAAKKTAPGDSQGQAEETKARGLEQRGDLAEAEAAYRRAASLYQVAGRAQAEQRAVLSVLKSYELAVESKNLEALTAIWPTIGGKAKTYRESFKYAQTWEVDLECSEVQLSGDAATVSCQRRDEMLSVDGQRHTPVSNPVFVLRKSGTAWVITELRQQ